MKFSKKILVLLVVLCISIGAVASASTISFNDSDLGPLLNKVYSVTASGTGGSFARFPLAGSNGSTNMVDSTAMTTLIQNKVLHISFDYEITEAGKKGLRVELRGGNSDKTSANVNPYWKGWQYDANAAVTPNETHHFEALINAPQLYIDQAGNSANYYLFVGGVGSTLTLTNIKIREWSTEGTALGLWTGNTEAYTEDKPEGYNGNVWHLNTAGLTKQNVRIIGDTIAFAAGKTYNVEFWYKTTAANASYFALVNRDTNSEYSKIDNLNKTGDWTKAVFTFTPDADMTGTYANFTKTDATSADACFTDFVVLPKAPVTNTVVTDGESVMVKDGEQIKLEGYFVAPETLEFKKGEDVISATKSSADTDFADYTKAVYNVSYSGTFNKPGTYTANVVDIWGVERQISVDFIKYSDEVRTLTTQRAKWELLHSADRLSVSRSNYNYIDLPALNTYLKSNCAVFKVEFDISTSAPVAGDDTTVTEILLRTGKDPGYTVYKVNNSELTTTPKSVSYIDNQSLTDRYNVSSNALHDRYNDTQWWFFVKNRSTTQDISITNIKIYKLTPDSAGNVLLGTASLQNLNANSSKDFAGALIFAKYENGICTAQSESFELKDTVFSNTNPVVEFAVPNGVATGETGYANTIIDYTSGADYRLFWLNSLGGITPLAECSRYAD